MLNSEFDATATTTDYLSASRCAPRSTASTSTIYPNVNNGVYRCGFAKTQAAYEAAYDALFATLDELEARLSRQRYLVGRQITEADWRLFPTLGALRRRLFLAVPLQQEADRRLSEPARTTCASFTRCRASPRP